MKSFILAAVFLVDICLAPASAADIDDVLKDFFNGTGPSVTMGTGADPNVSSGHNSGNDESDPAALPDGWVIGADGNLYLDGHLELERPANADATHYDENGQWQPSPWYQGPDGVVRYDDGSRPGDDEIGPACVGSGNADCNSLAGFYVEEYMADGTPVYGNSKNK
jgi:hypothetical protein